MNRRTILCLAKVVSIMFAATAVRAEDTATVNFKIDGTRDSKPISRYIYGVNQKLEGALANCTLTRSGGNRLTAYNWTTNASNAGSDWQFQNDDIMGGGDEPGGAIAPSIRNAAERHAGIILTVPMIGYVAADKNGGGDVRQSGADYLKTRFRESRPAKGSPFTLKPDRNAPRVFQDEFVNWVKVKFPYSQTDAQRPIFFDLDNEPDLWTSTHKVLHPDPLTYAEIVHRTIEYATAIKAVLPKALVFGPVSYGWQGYVNLQNAPDAANRDFLAFYLAELAKEEKKRGKRLIDVFDVHWYPEAQGGGARIVSPGASAEIAAARMQAPRSLWDSTYSEASWITQWSTKGPIDLIHRLNEKISKNYPGTKLAVTEYNYGGGGHISGAIAQADVLGILGREGVFAANEWPMEKDESFIAAAFRLYRDFDGKGGAFGDTSLSAMTDKIDQTSIYASTDSTDKHRMVLVALNKTDHPIKARIVLEHLPAVKVAAVYEVTPAAAEPRKAEAAEKGDGNDLSRVLPPFSASAIVLER